MPKGLVRPSIRDALLILLGAASFFVFSRIANPPGDQSIIFNTHFTHPDYSEPDYHPIDHSINDLSDVLAPPTPVHDDDDTVTTYGFPETTVVAHSPGWTLFRNLYMSNGTIFIVSSHPASSFPDIFYVTSTGLEAQNTPGNIAARIPTRDNMDFITPDQARAWWGEYENKRVWGVEGTTLLYNDPKQFLGHYYHFAAELLFGSWAFLMSTFTPSLTPSGELDLSHPASKSFPIATRAIFAHADAHGWRDGPGFNAYFMRAAFPSVTTEVQIDWEDRVALTSLRQRAWHFDQVLFTDRSAAFKGDRCGSTQRTAAEAFEFGNSTGKLKRGWWEPVRRAVLRFAGVEENVLDLASHYAQTHEMPIVVTYISRQAGRRRLIQSHHDQLVVSLQDLCTRKGWELNVIRAETLTKEQQFAVISRTTILLGVHGNGLSHLIMMPLTPISAVFEIFYPGGFAYDYEWTARSLGLKHFAVWNDSAKSWPNQPRVDYPEGFQGSEIPVWGPAVAKIVEDRVEGRSP